MTKISRVVTLTLLLLAAQTSAYEIETHQEISKFAALQSILNSDATLSQLGLRRAIASSNPDQMFPDSNGEMSTLLDLIGNGSKLEDDLPRPIYHFFDPRTNGALYIDPTKYPNTSGSYLMTLNKITVTSPTWAVFGYSSLAGNDYSFSKARDYLFNAITSSINEQRKSNVGLLFESLGRIIHHIEDMAQPQHVRNDSHLSNETMDTGCNYVEYKDICETYRALRRESMYERWTNRRDIRATLPMTGYAPVYPGSGDSPDGIAVFATPRQFWANAGKGMAEFANRNFFSAGTMDESPPFVDTSYDVELSTLCASATPSCEIVATANDLVTFFASYVDDQFRPNGGPEIHSYAASESLFSPELNSYTDHSLRTINRFTFARDYEFLIPRAVAYSAGLINYFFRGNLQIALPDEGIYSIVDHGSSGCGNPCGFRTLKLKVKNMTPGNGQFHEEPMGDDVGASNLWAVVKYHLNACYQPDLSGEDGGNHFNGNSCRSANEYVSVSAPHPVQIVSADQPQQIVFDFSGKPIPINASDIFLQVVFRGRLGMEDDAVAVATKDISEPTYYGLENVTDYAYDENGDQKYHPVASDASMVDVTDVHIAFGPNADKAEPVASLALLAGGQHAQIAVLMDNGPQQASISLSGEFGQAPAVVQFDPAEFTEDDEGAAAGLYQRNCDLVLRRGLYRERGVLFVQRTHGIVGGIHILDNQTSSAAAAELPVTSERHGVRTESVRDPRCTHLTTGVYDLSSMTPFVPEAAQSWTIRF